MFVDTLSHVHHVARILRFGCSRVSEGGNAQLVDPLRHLEGVGFRGRGWATPGARPHPGSEASSSRPRAEDLTPMDVPDPSVPYDSLKFGVAVWEAFYIVNKLFDLDTLRVANRSPTPASKFNEFRGQSEDIWGVRGRLSRPISGIPGIRAGIKHIYLLFPKPATFRLGLAVIRGGHAHRVLPRLPARPPSRRRPDPESGRSRVGQQEPAGQTSGRIK